MDSNTRDRLNRLNRAFYAAVADDFSATRQRPWPGWQRVLEGAKRCNASHRTSQPLCVLDLGCGNGRFARFLVAECDRPFRYLGVDSSRALLAIAHRHCRDTPHIEFALGDVLYCMGHTAGRAEVGASPDKARGLKGTDFDLVLLFGLLHHLPGFETRRELLHGLARHLAPGALLALAAWRFAAFERFRSRILSWDHYNRNATEPIDPGQLEPRDYLLGWGGQEAPPRYCHFVDQEEMEALLAGLELERVDEFTADGGSGDLNHYVMLQRSHGRR